MNDHFDWFRLEQVLTYMALSKNVIVTKSDEGLRIEAGCFPRTSQLSDAIADEEDNLHSLETGYPLSIDRATTWIYSLGHTT